MTYKYIFSHAQLELGGQDHLEDGVYLYLISRFNIIIIL